ncbi:uncharacterized protein LOC115232499 [Octopus sinensis]|uniref:Uncharacterized protein LOC115232499 n=1 Tax=Octopus sinensis TaxID=2607531 RepID=A0A6P7UBG4_9MOLL|nr:uncharacterized protein LOC115232499 [Octopus sinensis]
MICTYRPALLVLIIIVCLTTLMSRASAANMRSECGGKIRVYSPGNLTTPGYPGNYPKDSFCIWLLEAKDGYIVQLTIHQFNGHSLNNSCRDFIQIRDGSSVSQELLYSCNTTNKVVNSTSRRLWIKFKSDSLINNKGLASSWDTHYTGVSSENISSLIECVNSFQCSNDECVSKSSHCDGINDCGCMVGCDEHQCDKTEIMSFGAQMAIGISIGVALFAILFCGTLFVEWRNKWTKNITSNGRPHKPHLKSKEADAEVTERLGTSQTNNVTQSPEGFSTPTAATSLTITSMDTGKNASSSLLQSSAASSSPSSTITTTTTTAKTPPEGTASIAAPAPTQPPTTTTSTVQPPNIDNKNIMHNNKFPDESSDGTAGQSALL